ncbi:hypothetical protein MMC22_003804 [Lobaria immixta]|nr:hypothetical protein [Lobaria immixta]
MQTKVFLCAALFSTVSLVLADTTPSPSQQSKAVQDVRAYLSSVTAAPDWSSYRAIYAKIDSEDILGSNTKEFEDITADSKFTALPKGAQSYFINIEKGAESIASKDLFGGPASPASVATSKATAASASTASSKATGASASSATSKAAGAAATTGTSTGTSKATSTGTSKATSTAKGTTSAAKFTGGAAPKPTGAVMAAGAAAAGLLGVVALL